MEMTVGEEDCIARALADARARLQVLKRTPTGPAIVFDVLCEVLDIERRWKMPQRPASVGSAWPEYIHSPDEKAEAELQRMLDGAPINMRAPSPCEMSTMEVVRNVFYDKMVGKKKDQDWNILCLLADSRPVWRGKKRNQKQVLRPHSLREIAAEIGKRYGAISHTTVADRKTLQCAAIWKKVAHLMPLSRTETADLVAA